jgi:Tol biopolymer transport system component/C-terminal processing protease CtpA/Prc
MRSGFKGAFRRAILLASAAMTVAGVAAAQTAPQVAPQTASRPSLYEPALSPDGREIAFVSGGDIWTVPAAGGTAQLLVSNPATEGRPTWSPDGKALAFTSTREGQANIYVLDFATGQVRRLTWSDAPEQLDGWSADGRWIYFSSAAQDVGRQNDIFRVAASGGTPQTVSAEAFLGEFNAAPSPDGRSLAFAAKGMGPVQWWRDGHAHIDESELWLKPVEAKGAYRRLLPPDAKHLWPMWSPDGAALYFMSDASGAENLWRLSLAQGAKPEQVTRFTDGRVLFPKISADGRAIVFERDLAIWKLDVASGAARPVAITLRGAPAAAGERHLRETRFDEMALSPDGKKLVVTAHGQVFAAPSKDGGPGQRISEGEGAASDLVWSPDSRRLVYSVEEGLDTHLVEYDFATAKSRRLTSGPGRSEAAAFAPDGKSLAYRQGRKELRVIAFGADGAPARDGLLFAGMRDVGGPQAATWSPDGRWLAFGVTDARAFRNVWVVPAAGGEARPISFLANGQTSRQIAWSPDGKYIVFDTAQRSEDTHLVRVDLLPHVPKYREDELRDLFKPTPPAETKPGETPKRPAETPADKEEKSAAAAEAAVKPGAAPAGARPKVEPVRIVFEGIRERATLIPLGLSAEHPVISPDGKTLVFRADLEGQENLYSYDLDELRREPAVPQQLTSTRKDKEFYAFTPDSKSLYLLDGGSVVTTPLERPQAKPVAVEAELNVDFAAEKQVVFDEAWSTLDWMFFDPAFNGKDWKALRARFEPYVAGAKTPDELRRVINLMIGELNASHSGINPPQDGFGATPPSRVADLGLKFDREAYEAGRGLMVSEVVDLGPAALSGAIKPGDRLLAVNGLRIPANQDLGAQLVDQAGKRTTLTMASGGAEREVVVRPVSASAAAGLRYRAWVQGRRAYVEQASGGRLGYVHLADMSSDALNQLYLDLDAQNEARQGVVIDVRNNNGGFVNGYVLDVFTRKNFLLLTPRDLTALPSRQTLGQRALGLPTVLVTNESSLSDAEDFTEGYRALHLGKVVGVPTAGWIIYTGGRRLIDGSTVRTPFMRVQDASGHDMEMHPRPVDVMVERPLGEARDAQLEAAIAELLKEVPPAK